MPEAIRCQGGPHAPPTGPRYRPFRPAHWTRSACRCRQCRVRRQPFPPSRCPRRRPDGATDGAPIGGGMGMPGMPGHI